MNWQGGGKNMLNIVLFEPEIPANTGNIGRTCVATGTRLHLIEPLGFRINEKSLKRAGMDYWKDLDVTTYINYQDFLDKNPGAKIYMATTKAHKVYTEVDYEQDCYIMFGKESAGIPEEILVDHEEDCMRIPMIGDIRSLNLGNSVAIVLYEALRQNGFEGMNLNGHLHEHLYAESDDPYYRGISHEGTTGRYKICGYRWRREDYAYRGSLLYRQCYSSI